MSSVFEDSVEQALEALRTGEYTSIRATALAYGITESTLRRWSDYNASNRASTSTTTYTSARGVNCCLDTTGEDCKHPVTFPQLREFVGLVSKNSGGPATVGHRWIQRFLHRHPELRSKIGVRLIIYELLQLLKKHYNHGLMTSSA